MTRNHARRVVGGLPVPIADAVGLQEQQLTAVSLTLLLLLDYSTIVDDGMLQLRINVQNKNVGLER